MKDFEEDYLEHDIEYYMEDGRYTQNPSEYKGIKFNTGKAIKMVKRLGRPLTEQEVIRMAWDDVDEVLFNGKKEEIERVCCPECGGNISYSFSKNTMELTTLCTKCKTHNSKYKVFAVPSCVKIFGASYTLKND